MEKARQEEDEEQSQNRKAKDREATAAQRANETKQERDNRYGIQRTREQTRLQTMKKEDKKIQKSSSHQQQKVIDVLKF